MNVASSDPARPPVTINCHLLESDYRAFRRYVMFGLRKVHWLYAGMLGVLVAVVWFTNPPEATLTEKIAGLIGAIVVWGTLVTLFLLAMVLLNRISGRRFQGSLGPHTFEIADDTFIESNVQGRHEVRFAGLRHVAETPSHFFVVAHSGTGYVIPKRDLQHPEALRTLQQQIKALRT